LGSRADPNAMVKRKIPVRFQVPTAVTMKITECWYETVGSLVANSHNFGETYGSHLYPEDRGSRFLQNSEFLSDYMVSHPTTY